ncbi:2-oxoglutarate and iron-dependent oxygenase domain-containing protein [Roseomonas sp. E05]|uniref:isopenicillin N synthase family dioxygenase n=1 Tax=Roseomonas sp. E05 TaxID=3046310 RepID=UPI0024BAEE0F|nr:2-oxoglutarate and iron-dependent oxygenase domain-containing protein [Roseomonas sp. E05]MDJ0387156.1 2-oxoglutarate and iron-dependent oxygenase domain-containing protein [Roseomonas sp. E05]
MSIPIPILDARRLRDPATRRAAAAELGTACRGPGFFLVTGHGLNGTGTLFERARGFFAQPQAAKEAVSIRHSPHNRGYVALAEEALDRTTADRKEAFNIGLDLPPDDPEVLAGAPFRGVNLWPELAGFREATLRHFEACWQLGLLLHRGFALDLGVPEDFFEDKFRRPIATLRLLRYPGGDGGSALGAGAHTDYGNVTILATDGVPGLEIRLRDGDWIAAPDVPGALICNIGDCLMRWSNGVYASTPHRVRAPERERFSAAFFLDPDPDAVVEALPSCVSPENPPRWPATTGADYLRERLDATYAHRRRAG